MREREKELSEREKRGCRVIKTDESLERENLG